MKKLIVLLFIPITLLVFTSCSDDVICEIEEEINKDNPVDTPIDNTIAFHDEEFTAYRKELLGSNGATSRGTINSLEKITSVEYKLNASITVEGKDYNLETTFNPYEDRAPISINGDATEGYAYVNPCTNCSANLNVQLYTTWYLNSLNYIRFSVIFNSDL
jgi:hypothetical protein